MAQLDCATSFMIRVFFGSPGAGKTTLAVAFAKRFKRRGYKSAWLNFETQGMPDGCFQFDINQLGFYTPPEHAYVVVDEAGIDYNNRAYKAMPREVIRYFKLHRHYAVDIDVFSQSWDDMDVTIRRLANELWHIVRLGPWTACRLVTRYVTVDKDSHQIVDGYKQASKFAILTSWLSKFVPLFSRKWMLIRRRKFYKHFNSWTRPNIPIFAQYTEGGERRSVGKLESPKTSKVKLRSRLFNLFHRSSTGGNETSCPPASDSAVADSSQPDR